MRTFAKAWGIALGLALSAACGADEATTATDGGSNPVRAYYATCIGNARVMGTTLAGMASGGGPSGDVDKIFNEARECVETKFKPALDDAAGNADLIAALKAYHVGVLVWIGEASRIEGSPAAYKAKADRIRGDFDPLMQKLRLEAQLAGKLPAAGAGK